VRKLAIEPWAVEYGAPVEAEALAPTEAVVDDAVELKPDAWRPLRPDAATGAPDRVAFVDGVRRIDARVWITDDDGAPRPGLLASFAAGVACCEGTAAGIESVEVRRALFARAPAPDLETRAGRYGVIAVPTDEPDQLANELQQRMRHLEREIAEWARNAGGDGRTTLVVLDGPLSAGQNLPGAVGYVKTHHVSYLDAGPARTIGALTAGERSPMFVTRTTWSRWSWYVRLPAEPGHPWAGVVRCEASTEVPLEEAQRLADRTALALPRFASAPHKDPRAPQNLYPIAALERELRRRLGDAAWVYRALRSAV
jgi:hypothetical protein